MNTPNKILILDANQNFCIGLQRLIYSKSNQFIVRYETDNKKAIRLVLLNGFDILVLSDSLEDWMTIIRNTILMGKPIIMCCRNKYWTKLIFKLVNADLREKVVFLNKNCDLETILQSIIKIKDESRNINERLKNVFKVHMFENEKEIITY